MKIKTGQYDVLYSGTVIQIKGEPIEITLPDLKDNPLILIIKFIDDKNEKGMVTNFNLLDKHSLEITFTNFNNSLGVGNTELTELGTLNDRKLFFNYRVYDIKSIGKTFHYTFYSGEEVKNG